MPYSTQADLTEQLSESKLVQLTDDEKLGITNPAIADRVTRAIATADSTINGYTGVRYVAPIAAPIPALIKSWSVTLAVYHLWLRRQTVPDDVRLAYEDVMARLRDVSTGKMTLGVDPAPVPSGHGLGGEIFGPDRVWTHDTMKGW